MKVLVISHSAVLKSTHARWKILAERYGTEVHLAVPAEWRFSWFGAIRAIRAEPDREPCFEVHPLKVWQRGTSLSFVFLEGFRLLASIKPDVVYIAQDWNSLALQQVLGILDIVPPRLATWGFSSYMERIEPPSWRSKWMWDRFRSKITRAKTYSKIGARVLGDSGFPGAIDVETEIGVDLNVFRPDAAMRDMIRERLKLRGFVIGYAGRLVEEKGVKDLLQACQNMPSDWNLLLIGDGPWRSKIEEHASRDRLFDRLRFVGYVPHEEVPRFLQACDILVLPTKRGPKGFIEQFGLVLAQAMACGVPVVGSDNGAIPEVIGDSRRIFPEGDSEALSNILTELMEDFSYREEVSRIGLERVSRLYSASALADSFQNSLLRHAEGR